MMKKLLFLGVAILTFSYGAKSQSPGTTSVVTDVVHYYFNKLYYKSNIFYNPPAQWPYYKAAAATVTNVTHVGSVFENCEDIDITGLETVSFMTKRGSQLSVPVHLYLCNVNANGVPVLPPIDSVAVNVNSIVPTTFGGNFTKVIAGSLTPVSHRMTGNFAVLERNFSTHAGDTVYFLRTSSKTYTAWPNVSWTEKYSDSYGFLRYGANFKTTKNDTSRGFGYGTDYEFCVAPRVSYTITARELWPQKISDGSQICTHEAITFTNVSSCRINHRMYNLIEFHHAWATPLSPMAVSPQAGWPVDSSIVWKFDNSDNGSVRSRFYLKSNGGVNTMKYQTDSVIHPYCSDQNFFRVNMWGMNNELNTSRFHFNANEQFTTCIVYCNGDTVGINENFDYPSVSLYPNPTTMGKATVSGLRGTTTISVYNTIGQLVAKEITDKERVTIDLLNQPNGYYLLRLVNDKNQSRTVNLIKRSE